MMFWKQKANPNLQNSIVPLALDNLKRAGYSAAMDDEKAMKAWYKSHKVALLEPELQTTVLMMWWLVKKYGSPSDVKQMEMADETAFKKPQNSIFYYWIPSQFVRFRQLGGEINLRARGKMSSTTPEPTMKQVVLEDKYRQAKDAINALRCITAMPVAMDEQFLRMAKKTDAILSVKTQTAPLPNRTIPMADNTEFSSRNVKSMKPKYRTEEIPITSYINGDIDIPMGDDF